MATLEPYLFFNGNCEEALNFYKSAIGAEIVALMRFKEAPEPPPPGMLPNGYDEKIMHALFRVAGNNVMASDGCGEGGHKFDGFSLALNFSTAGEVEKIFSALQEGGEVTMPLGKTFWSPLFGMLTDRYGLGWMVGVEQKCQES